MVGCMILAAPAAADQPADDGRSSVAQRHDRDRRDNDAAEAAAGFLGLFLGLLGGLREQGAVQPACDAGAFYGWAQTRHPAYGYAMSYPQHWRQQDVNVPNVVQVLINPCPPHAAIIVARSPVGGQLAQPQLEAVMHAFQKEGGVFATMLSQEPAAGAGQPRRKGLFRGYDDGVDMVALVHAVSSPPDLYLVVGLAPDASGQQAGTMLRYTIESFVPPTAFAPGG